MTPACPDPWLHQRWHEEHEQTLMRAARNQPIPVVPGRCAYCGGTVELTEVELAGALVVADMEGMPQ